MKGLRIGKRNVDLENRTGIYCLHSLAEWLALSIDSASHPLYSSNWKKGLILARFNKPRTTILDNRWCNDCSGSYRVYYPIYLHCFSDIVKGASLTLYRIFLDVVWYPVYEETTYRSFTLAHFANPDEFYLSKRNLIVNATQSLLFLSIHKHHFPMPLVLVPVFFLAFLNGMLFLRMRTIYGCIVSHSILNGFALLLRYWNRW